MVQITNIKSQINSPEFTNSKSAFSSVSETTVPADKTTEPIKPKMPTIPKDKTIDEAVNKTNDFLEGGSIRFRLDGNKTIVTVVDKDTNQIIRQIPSEEALAIAENLDKLQGMLINSRA